MLTRLIPGLALFAAVGGAIITWRFYAVFAPDIEPDLETQFYLSVAVIFFAFESLAAMFYGLYRVLGLKILQRTIRIDDEGVHEIRPSRTITAKWDAIQKVDSTAVGRFQKAVVIFPKGAIRFDATFTDVEAKARPRFTARLEVAEYEDGTRVPMLMAENELLKAIREHVAAS